MVPELTSDPRSMPSLPTGTVIDRSNSLNVIAPVLQLLTCAAMPSGTLLERVSASANQAGDRGIGAEDVNRQLVGDLLGDPLRGDERCFCEVDLVISGGQLMLATAHRPGCSSPPSGRAEARACP